MAVSLVDGGVGSQAIEIAIPFHVINPDPFAAFDDNVERMVVVGSVAVFKLDKIFGLQTIDDFHKLLKSLVGVSRVHLINAGADQSEVPQRLKPGPKTAIGGTAESRALSKPICAIASSIAEFTSGPPRW